MEFARRIGDLAHLTRRLSRVRADKVRAQHLVRSSSFIDAEASFAHRSERAASDKGVALDGGDADEHRGLALRRGRRSEAPTSREAQERSARVQDQLLLRRIPIAVSLVERSWSKLDHTQREREGRRQHQQQQEQRLVQAGRPSSFLPSADAANEVPVRALGVAAALPALSGSQPASQIERRGAQSGNAFLLRDDNGGTPPPARPPTTPASRQQVEAVCLLLQLLHTIEQARRQHLEEKLRAAQHRCEMADSTWHSFQKEFGSQLRQRRPLKANQRGTPMAEEDEALLRETADALQRRRGAARSDLSLLQSSLLTRPLLSSRLWRGLLRESVWTAAVVEHKRAAAAGATAPASGLDVTQLLALSLALTRITMGILRDYVQGGRLSRHAPRFVVSLPSHAFRARVSELDTEEANDPKRKGKGAHQRNERRGKTPSPSPAPAEDDNEDKDVLFAMLESGADAPAPASSSTHAPQAGTIAVRKSRRSGNTAVRMRWIPPHTAEVMPLVLDTLALHSFILPELEIAALLQRGCAEELISLCVTLQRIASTTLTLAHDDGGAEANAVLHRSLSALESALGDVGAGVVDHLVAACQSPTSELRGVGRGRFAPEEAARLAVQLHTLRLLPRGNSEVDLLLAKLLADIFPQLRTQTGRVLQEKARQSSLLAFATRPHRHMLYQQHGRKGAEQYVLETVVQQARLQQRQLAAALRGQHVTEAHVRALRELAQRVPPSDLIRLLHLYARRTSERGGEAESASASDESDLWVAGCLFLAEAILLSGSSTSAAPAYALPELAILWDAATILFPLIRARRSRQSAQQRGAASRGPRVSPAVHTESVIWATFAEHVLASINAMLAKRLQQLEEQRQGESTAMRGGGVAKRPHNTPAEAATETSTAAGESVDMDTVVALVAGLLEYAGQDASLRQLGGGVAGEGRGGSAHTPSSLLPVQQSVRVLARLLHDLVIHDRALWHRMRRLPGPQRGAVERQLRECFHTLGMLDDTTTDALRAMNREEDVYA